MSRKDRVKRRFSAGRAKQLRFIVIGLFPVMTYFLIFSVYPVTSAFYISLHRWGLLEKEKPFFGMGNYLWAFNDPVFWVSVKNTIYFAFFYVLLGIVFGLLLALFVNSLRDPFKSLMRGVIFMPVVTSMVAVALMFVWLYQPTFGVLNYVLGFIGLGPYEWLNSSSQAMPSIIIMSVWKSVGYTMVLFLAGLTTIPGEFYEAARVDGASQWRTLLHITIPLLKPTTLFVLVTGMIGAFQVFTQIYVMTQGGPGTATRTLVMHIYETGFKFFEMGRASALAFILFALVLVATILQLKYFKPDFEY
ncbi:MAG: sugar ABC transporter permease [Firmicutes bacterium]|nr:sugar ABC transporter permease [Bacillota bacterium]